MSNEPLAKAKSWELRFYRKERRKASKKLTASRTRLSTGESAFPKTMADSPPKAQILAGRPHLFWQRVDDNAFHQLELSALFRFR